VGRRRKAREIVLQALYEAEFSDSQWEEILSNQTSRRDSRDETVEYARSLFSKTLENKEHIDAIIRSALQNWEMERVSLVDRNILRFALCEILFFPDVPPKVIVNEAIEIAHKYSSEEAGRFVNGILDRFLKQYRGASA
jgi:N utilization substance protein B